MRTQITALFAASTSFFVAACSSSSNNGGATTACTSAAVTNAQQQVACMGANIVANEANNYAFTSTMKLPPVTVKSMSDLKFEWGGVTQDFLGHTIDPKTDLDIISLLIFSVPISELETRLNADTLTQQDVLVVPPPSWPADPVAGTGGVTTAQLFSFTGNGTPITPDMFYQYLDPATLPPTMFSYMVAAASGTTIGEGFRMLQTFKLDAASSSTTIAIKDNSTQLTCQVSLRNLTITGVPGGTPALTLDWSDMVARSAKNGLGGVFKDNYVTSAIVGHFAETPAELEKKFLDLDMIATTYYTADITQGAMLDFSTLKDKNGAAFPGVDDTGTWMVGLQCGNCRNPAPWYMAILKPCTM